MFEATPRQRRILDFIRQFSAQHGMPPTRADIAAHFGIERASVQQNLQLLAKKGLLELVPGASRGIRLLEAVADPFSLPLVGRIAAGQPLMSADHIEEQLRVDPALFRPAASFLFRVEGHSMRDAHILDRDLVGIREQPVADNHQIVAVAVTDRQTGDLKLTLKRFRQQGPIVTLISENSDQERYAPIVIDTREQEVGIVGLFAGLLRTGG
jgi:repressor LexA